MNVRAFYNMISIVSFQKLQIERNKKNMGNKSSVVAYVSCVADPPPSSVPTGVFCLGGCWQRGFLAKGVFG